MDPMERCLASLKRPYRGREALAISRCMNTKLKRYYIICNSNILNWDNGYFMTKYVGVSYFDFMVDVFNVNLFIMFPIIG
jgi:hypothetical protein